MLLSNITEKDFKKFSRAFLGIDKDISFSFLTRAHLVAISAKSDRNLQTRYWQEPIEDWEKFIKRLEEVWKKKYKVSDVNASSVFTFQLRTRRFSGLRVSIIGQRRTH